MNMEIRKIQRDDLDQLGSIYCHLHEDESAPDSELTFDVWNDSEGSGIITYWGLFLQGVLVSTCQMVIVPNITRGCKPYCLIENVVTHPDFRNNGYGKAILKHTLEHAWSQGCYKAMLMTSRKSESVHNFYSTAGFNGSEKHAYIAKPKNT
ncbi:MAG: GNAT family N-acetyltransferase [Gammaproteobacteria bacterium]|nr:GNAT family N-acetyltransferase [Gammaproteobacteria bacterium]